MSEDFDFLDFDELGSDTVVEPQGYEPEHRLAGGAGVAVVDEDQAVADYLAGMFEGAVETAPTLEAIEPKLGLASTVLVLGPSCATQACFDTIQHWSRTHPNVAAVLVTPELSTSLLQDGMRAGIKDMLSAPIDQAALLETVDRVADGLPSAEQMVAQGSTPPPSPEFDGEIGRVLSIFSTKGGSGKSVTATNLAVVLARRSAKPVVLIDGHMQFGDVAVMLKLQPEHTVLDAIAQLDGLDVTAVEHMMTIHEPSGLYVLAAPLEPSFADQITGEQVATLLEIVRQFAGHVIVDLPAIFNEVVLSVIENSDEIVLVAGLDIPNIKNVKIGLSTLAMLGVAEESLHLVLNRADSKVKLDVSEVERTLGVTASAHVPSDVVVPISVNKGSPVVLSAAKSGVARAFEQLALRFADGATAEAGPVGGRRKFFG